MRIGICKQATSLIDQSFVDRLRFVALAFTRSFRTGVEEKAREKRGGRGREETTLSTNSCCFEFHKGKGSAG